MYGVVLTTVLISIVPLVVLSSPTSTTLTSTQITNGRAFSSWNGWKAIAPTYNRIPVATTIEPIPVSSRMSKVAIFEEKDEIEGRDKSSKYFKKYKRYMLPLLLAYKLKFFTLIPVFIGGLVLLTGATGLAGFFFALFAATMGLKGGGDH